MDKNLFNFILAELCKLFIKGVSFDPISKVSLDFEDDFVSLIISAHSFEPPHEITNNLLMRKQRRKSASR